MNGALHGTRVIDLSQGWAGPGASMYLADQGADVVKVEPLNGDIARAWYPSPALSGTSRSFVAINRNKRGMTVDLRSDDGKAVVHDLARWADVFIVNLRAPAAARLRIDFDTFSALNPRLIYAVVSGYGRRGPYADRPAFDAIVQGLSGAMHRRLPDGTPLRAGVWTADCTAPMLLAYGITLALLARERTGRGQRVDTSLLESAIALQAVDLVQLDADPEPIPAGSLIASGLYRCADDRYINVAALTEEQVVAMLTTLGLDQILSDATFAGPDRDVTKMQRRWRKELVAAFAARPAAEWLERLTDVDVPCGPVLSRDDVFSDPQVLANDAVVTIEQPGAGPVRVVGVPVHLSEHPGAVSAPAPALGEHTDRVLADLGYPAERVAELRRRQVIG